MLRGPFHSHHNSFFNEQDLVYLEFERCCEAGDLTHLKQLEVIKKESIFLKGLFSSIAASHLELIHYLIHHPAYQNYIFRHRQKLKTLLLEKNILCMLETSETTASGFEIGLNVLKTLYNTKLCAANLKQHLNHLKNGIATLWQSKGLQFQTEKLPLEYDAYLKFCLEQNPNHLPSIEKIYLQDPLHRCWRLFNHTQNWFGETFNTSFFQHQAWTIVLFWLAVSDPDMMTTSDPLQLNLGFRINYFLERLPQAPQTIPEFYIYLFQSILAHPYCHLLNEDKLQLELSNFTQLHPVFDFQKFHHYMQSHWQYQWQDNHQIQQLAKQLIIKKDFNFSFFYSNTIQSNKPVTNDFLLPLS